MKHEMGHSIGLGHAIYMSGTIMGSELDLGYDITTFDVNQVNSLY